MDEFGSSGDKEIQIARMLPVFRDIFELMKKTSFIILNIVNQLHSLYFSKEKYYKNTFKYFQLFSPIETLGKACGLIYTIDLVLKENPAIKEDFNRYKTMIRTMNRDPVRYGVTDTLLKKLDKVLSRYDRTILGGNCF